MNAQSVRPIDPPRPRVRVRTDRDPWYRQFWPWFLIALPASSVVFSFATLFVALRGADTVLPHQGDSASWSAPREPARVREAPSATASMERKTAAQATHLPPANAPAPSKAPAHARELPPAAGADVDRDAHDRPGQP